MSSSAPRVLVIAGMHRSGTSLVASLLHEAGANMGDRLLGADRGNPRGHFEDADFVEFHREALFARDQHVRVASDFVFEPTDAERQRVREILDARSGRALWGWKDPRTALFLDFWDRQLPDARYILLYRHPVEVLLSLVHRADVNYVGLTEAIDAWVAYNRAVLAFRDRHAARTVLCEIHALLADVGRFGRLLGERLAIDLPIDGALLESVYAPAELRTLPEGGPADDVIERLYPSAAAVLRALDDNADMPSLPAPRPGHETQSPGWLAAVPPDPPAGAKRAWLTVLVGHLAPDALEALYDESRRHDAERDRAVEWLKAQRQAQAGELDRCAAEIESLRDTVQRQAQAHADEVDSFARESAELRRAVALRDEAEAWLEAQARAQGAEIEHLETHVADLRSAIDELERGKAWLAGQIDAHAAEIERWREEYERLKAWTLDRERTVTELLAQVAALKDRP